MLILPTLNKVFVHVPRTRGNTLCDSIIKAGIPAVKLTNEYTHLPIWEVKKMLPGYETFTILRHPEEIYMSYYGFVKWILRDKPTEGLVKHATFLDGDFDTFLDKVLYILCSFGGFKHTFADSGTTVFYFSSITLDLQVKDYLGVDFSWEHDYLYPSIPITMSDEARNKIKHYCWKDYVR